jgi:hypothetical protein
MKNLFLSKESSLIIRREYATMLNDGSFSIYKVLKNDPEILYVRTNDSITFIRYYNKGLIFFKSGNFKRAINYFKHAAMFRPGDTIVAKFIQEINLMT